jgi:uncharacterized membrane protein
MNEVSTDVATDSAIVVSCAGTGALVGSCFPLVGTAIGGGIGAIIGGIAVIFRELDKRKVKT